MKDKLLIVSEVAKRLRLDEKTIYRMISEGKIPFTKVGGSYRFSESDIDEWLKKQTKGKSNEPNLNR